MQEHEGREHLWAIVLAAGDGQRVSAQTTDAAGRPLPKQYCSFGGRRSMLRWALERARGVVPLTHVVTVVAQQHRRFWERDLWDVPRDNLVVQPQNRGTAAGILLPFLHIFLRCDPKARIVVLPSDHFVADEATLRKALVDALQTSGLEENRVVLLGMTPRELDPEYGWILPASSPAAAIGDVAGFVEKPRRETARRLMSLGALVNTFIIAAQASALLRLYEEALPGVLRLFLACLRAPGPSERLEQLYDSLPASDFSRDVLERSTHRLSVIAVPECEWSDLGTPARIQVFLSGRGRPERRTPAKTLPCDMGLAKAGRAFT